MFTFLLMAAIWFVITYWMIFAIIAFAYFFIGALSAFGFMSNDFLENSRPFVAFRLRHGSEFSRDDRYIFLWFVVVAWWYVMYTHFRTTRSERCLSS